MERTTVRHNRWALCASHQSKAEKTA
jgi:hypothetical protein